MTPVQIEKLKNLDLLMFYNCIRETIEALEYDGSFSARVGVDMNYAKEVLKDLKIELEQRPDF